MNSFGSAQTPLHACQFAARIERHWQGRHQTDPKHAVRNTHSMIVTSMFVALSHKCTTIVLVIRFSHTSYNIFQLHQLPMVMAKVQAA